MLAEEMGLDGALARRCGLLHDIGKAADHEMEGGHPKIGAELLKRYGETAGSGPRRRSAITTTSRRPPLHGAGRRGRRHRAARPGPPRERWKNTSSGWKSWRRWRGLSGRRAGLRRSRPAARCA